MPAKKPLAPTEALALDYPIESKISPDGRHIALVNSSLNDDNKQYERHLYLLPTDGGSPQRLTFTHTTLGQIRWAPDSQALAFVSKGPDAAQQKSEQLWLLSLAGGEPKPIIQAPAGAHSPAWAPNGKSLLYIAPEPIGQEEQALLDKGGIIVVDRFIKMHQLWVLDLASGTSRQLTRDRSSKAAASWAPNGKKIVFEQRPDPTQNALYQSAVYTLDCNGKNKKKISPNAGSNTAPCFSPDGQQIAFLHRRQALYAFPDLVAVAPASGGSMRLLTETLDREASHLIWQPDSQGLYCQILDGVRATVYQLPLHRGTNQPILQGDRVLSALSLSADGNKLAFISATATSPGQVHLANSSGKKEKTLTQLNPSLTTHALATTKAIHWTSDDGLRLEGLLTLPPNYKKGKPIPLIVEPHGGPAGRSSFMLAPMRQVLAGKGYAIFAPNFRGSAGYGTKFVTANENDFGGGDFKDTMAGLDMLVDSGLADAKRLGIMGSSYGGFMTSWTIGHTDRFKAAVDGAGVHNLCSFFGTSDIQWFTHQYQCGYPWENLEGYLEQSPITHVRNIKTPTLIYHGVEDRRVPIEQGEQLYIALKHRRVPTEFVRYPREGHSLSEYWHRLDMMERALAWMDKYVKGKKDKKK